MIGMLSLKIMPAYAYNADLLLINAFLWLLMFYICKPFKVLMHPALGAKQTRSLYNCCFIIMYIYSVFAFADHDTYHTWREFALHSKLGGHYEPFYKWLSVFLDGNYFLWRACVWGVAVGSLYFVGRWLNLCNRGFLIIMILFLPHSYFCATRGASGHALALLGFILFIGDKPVHKRHFILGILAIAASFFLHKSNFLFIAFLLIGWLLPLRFSKSAVWTLLLAYPLFTFVITFLLNSFIQGDFQLEFGEDMNIQGYSMEYVELGRKQYSVLTKIIDFYRLLPYLLSCAYLTYKISFKKIKIDKIYYFLYKFSFIAVYVAMLFYFQPASDWLYRRIFFMSIFPMIFVFGKLVGMETTRSKLVKFIFWNQLIYVLIFSFSYWYYKWR